MQRRQRASNGWEHEGSSRIAFWLRCIKAELEAGWGGFSCPEFTSFSMGSFVPPLLQGQGRILVLRTVRPHGDKHDQHRICSSCLLVRTQDVSGTSRGPDSGSSLLLSMNQASQVVLVVKNLPANAGDIPWVGQIPWRRKGQPTPVFLPGESQGQRSLAG